ncbi:DNA-3-methyladenine glycosylase 2 family protein [Segetibacter sp.]|jgi:DNA-3-methyladenine glycosylase II|uniref:DNA-3-methyladenine glycosylase family protein n=1 Tax=Segetibacter sp. TaxID=2231182 RepID=UPI002637CB1A|nr:DNA-3-methyladenine glycosylase 2 family protein [Segetibacter sp.]MCW3079282.1 DNA-3-methyladenine glycosylase 2 family protein [Segetibacter sp.]
MDYLLHLQKDKKLAKVLKEPLPLLQMRQNIPVRLMASIMSQQLSTKVAKVIYNRFLEIFGGEEPEPGLVLDTPFETLRGIGLSNAKVNYVQNVARFCLEHEITDTKLLSLSNEDIISLLTQIKGVGKWTVEMLLMFTLGREDVFAVDDLGIQQAMIKVYKIASEDKKAVKEKMLKISSKWAPYRTYACLHLWNWKDAPVVAE